MQGVPVSKASAIISKEWEKVKVSEKKMKKYKELCEEEKQQHEETLQRYQEDHADEMEIIKLHKKSNKKDRKVLQPKALSKSNELKKTIADPREEEQKPRKASSDVKRTTTKAGKKVKKTSQPKKAPTSPEFADSDSGDTDDEKEPPLLGMKGEAQSFFDRQKESKNLTIEKRWKKQFLWRDLIKVMTYHMLHYVIPNTSKGC